MSIELSDIQRSKRKWMLLGSVIGMVSLIPVILGSGFVVLQILGTVSDNAFEGYSWDFSLIFNLILLGVLSIPAPFILYSGLIDGGKITIMTMLRKDFRPYMFH